MEMLASRLFDGGSTSTTRSNDARGNISPTPAVGVTETVKT